MLVFDNTPGVVGAIVVPGQTLPFAVIVGGQLNANQAVPEFPYYRLAKAVLTGFQLAGKAGLGITHTLRDRIYAYVFGERMGKAQLSGVAFAGICDPEVPNNYTGFDAVFAYYENIRVSQQGLPVRLVFGPQTSLVGLMDEFVFNLEDPQSGAGTFAFSFRVLPRYTAFNSTPPLPWDVELVTGP